MDNNLLHNVRIFLVTKLIELGDISGKHLLVDSCPILSNVKENNLKTSVRSRFRKDKIPINNTDCRLGVYPAYKTDKVKPEFYWGYRNHIINDCESELPLIEVTHPANVRGTHVICGWLEFIKDDLNLSLEAVMADSEYDSSSIIQHIAKDIGARPRI